jgi:hypothetical protein
MASVCALAGSVGAWAGRGKEGGGGGAGGVSQPSEPSQPGGNQACQKASAKQAPTLGALPGLG